MRKAVVILKVDKRGKYLCMVPNLEEGKLTSNNLLLNGVEFRPFGFAKHYSGNTLSYSDDSEETKKEAQLEAFKKFIDWLQSEADAAGLDPAHIMVEIMQDQDADEYWCFTANYQFMLRYQ